MTAEQKARDLLERMGIDGAQSMTADYVVEIANLIADSENLWVNVKDRLPEPNVKVLVIGGGEIRVMYGVIRKLSHRFCWYPGGRPVGHTTHWRPLPTMPTAK